MFDFLSRPSILLYNYNMYCRLLSAEVSEFNRKKGIAAFFFNRRPNGYFNLEIVEAIMLEAPAGRNSNFNFSMFPAPPNENRV